MFAKSTSCTNHAQSLLLQSDNQLVKQQAEVDLALSYLQYESGDTELAISTLEVSLGRIPRDSQPELYVRSTALLGGLLNVSGRHFESLAMLEELLKTTLPESLANRVEFARTNYASTLEELGRVEEASKAYH